MFLFQVLFSINIHIICVYVCICMCVIVLIHMYVSYIYIYNILHRPLSKCSIFIIPFYNQESMKNTPINVRHMSKCTTYVYTYDICTYHGSPAWNAYLIVIVIVIIDITVDAVMYCWYLIYTH